MWTCAKCGEVLEDAFDECWKCGTFKDGVENPEFKAHADPAPEPADPAPMRCARCDELLEPAEPRLFERFEVYQCPRCGRAEFFVAGIGAKFRASPSG